MSEVALQEQGSKRSALGSRLGSVVGIAPLGVWTTWHLWENLSSWDGAEVWQATVSQPGNTGTDLLVSAMVFAPLLLHTAWGFTRLRMTQPNGYKFFGNAKYLLQRLSALGLLGFLIAHVYLARIKPLTREPGYETFEDIAAHMRHHPPTLVVYVLGVLGVAYHLANGVYTTSFIFGLAASPRARRIMQGISMAFFAFLLLVGWGAIAGLYQGGANFAPPTE
jgi:succinate dehydrogenase / fumarate reductase cytochrome b subunit